MTVTYDPKVLGFDALCQLAKEHGCTDYVWVRDEEQARIAKRYAGANVAVTQDEARPSKTSDLLYYLRKSPLRYLPMSNLQRIRVNAALGTKGDPHFWLSPRQAKLAPKLADEAKRKELGLTEVLPDVSGLL